MILDGNIYFLQYGIYTKKDVMNDILEKLDNYFVINEDGKYYIYLGAYSSLDNALNYQKILEEDNIYTYIKNDYLDDEINDDIKRLESELTDKNNFQEMKEINNKIVKLFNN